MADEMEPKMQVFERSLQETLAKIETTINLLKDAKYVIAYQNLNGVKQKLTLMFDNIRKYNENNKDK